MRKHTQGFVGRGRFRRGAPEVAKIIGIHGTHATITCAVHTDVPAVLTVKDLTFVIIVEGKGFFDLGVHPEGESQEHKD